MPSRMLDGLSSAASFGVAVARIESDVTSVRRWRPGLRMLVRLYLER